MNACDCRFYSPPPPRTRQTVFKEGLFERSKTYSGSILVEPDQRISRAGWMLKQLARDQLRKPEIMGFIGKCLGKSPQSYGVLYQEPDAKALQEIIKEAAFSSPAGKGEIIRSAQAAIGLLKVKNRLIFESPGSAFAYYDHSPWAKEARAAAGEEIREIRMGLHERGHFIPHPKIVAMHQFIRERAWGPCIVLCESGEQAKILSGIGWKAIVDISTDPEAVSLRLYSSLVLFSPTVRLKEAIWKFRGSDVIIIAMKATWEEGAYRHFIELENASRPAKQGRLGLDAPCDRP